MFLDPDKLALASPAEILEAAARGHLGLDHRFLHALLDRCEEALPAAVAAAARDRNADPVDLTPELMALFRHWNTPESIPFFIGYIKEDPEEVPDEAVEALVGMGRPALEPLLALYADLDESESGEVAFVLAHLRIKDDRILQLLLGRLEYDLSDTALLLSIYGDRQAVPAVEAAAASLDASDRELKKELAEALRTLQEEAAADGQAETAADEPFDIWELYPEHADLPVDLLSEEERTELLTHPVACVRAAAAASFFNHELDKEDREELLKLAQSDDSAEVRGRAWEALMGSTDEPEVVEAMLAALRRETPPEERGGLLVGLAPEADRNEVRKAIAELYDIPGGRAKALEAMWRSVHPSFRDYFAKHLDDADLEVRRGAIWGVGYYGVRSEIDRLRKLFDHEELRSDALFAYALALPAEVSRGRMKGLLARIEKDANGLSEMEEELVKAALDERLMLSGKEPVFLEQED